MIINSSVTVKGEISMEDLANCLNTEDLCKLLNMEGVKSRLVGFAGGDEDLEVSSFTINGTCVQINLEIETWT